MKQENRSSKTLKGQLLGAISMMLVAAIALGTSTYAWFINNQAVEVQDMQLTVSASTSMMVAVGKPASIQAPATAANWTEYKTVITNPDITSKKTTAGDYAAGADWEKMFTNPMGPASVSTRELITGTPVYYRALDKVAGGLLTEFAAVTKGTDAATQLTAELGQGLVKRIPLRFLASTELKVYFGRGADTTVTPNVPLLTAIDQLITPVAATPATPTADEIAMAEGIRAALRVAIVPKTDTTYTGTIAPMVFQFDDGTGKFAGSKNNTDYSKAKATAQDPDNLIDDTTGVPQNGESTGVYPAVDGVDTDKTVNKVGKLQAIIPTAAVNSIAKVEGTTVTEPTTTKTPLFTLVADKPRDVDIYIWLEGTDQDCISALSQYKFKLNLPFAAVPTTTP